MLSKYVKRNRYNNLHLGKDITHETEIEIGKDRFTVIWGSFANDYIPENRTAVDTYIKKVDPEIRKKYGDTKILTECIETEEYNAR